MDRDQLAQLWDSRELLAFLVWRDIRVRYKQTFLGVAWAVLQPVLTMLIFIVLFGVLASFDRRESPIRSSSLRRSSPGSSSMLSRTAPQRLARVGAHSRRRSTSHGSSSPHPRSLAGASISPSRSYLFAYPDAVLWRGFRVNSWPFLLFRPAEVPRALGVGLFWSVRSYCEVSRRAQRSPS